MATRKPKELDIFKFLYDNCSQVLKKVSDVVIIKNNIAYPKKSIFVFKMVLKPPKGITINAFVNPKNFFNLKKAKKVVKYISSEESTYLEAMDKETNITEKISLEVPFRCKELYKEMRKLNSQIEVKESNDAYKESLILTDKVLERFKSDKAVYIDIFYHPEKGYSFEAKNGYKRFRLFKNFLVKIDNKIDYSMKIDTSDSEETKISRLTIIYDHDNFKLYQSAIVILKE
jgi:hypothetical protein